jgi:oxygen-independent coproporphyrinogen-3 oxidase
MYLRAIDALAAAGFAQYEIANFARPGRQCAHNRVYWHNHPYYGIGLGATGYVHRRRVERPRRLAEYFRWTEAGTFPEPEPLGAEEELIDTLLFGLRLLEGVEIAGLQARFGAAAVSRILEVLAPARDKGWLVVAPDRLRLSVPQGLLFSNEIFTLLV